MRFFKNYFYNKKLKAEQLLEAQKDMGKIHSVLITLVAENKVEAEEAKKRHEKRTELLKKNHENIIYFWGVSNEALGLALKELKESLDNFLQSQAGMNNIIKKFFKMEIDNATAESVTEKEEPTPHDLKF